jgi:iron complex transport system ATP-binding protein
MRVKKMILEISNLQIERGDVKILDGISWSVERGQHWAILGANGSGKTSLLSALTGYLMPTAGEIHLLGKIYGQSDWRELRKRIGLVSSSVRQMMSDKEPALETVASGKYAMIDFWGGCRARTRIVRGKFCDKLNAIILPNARGGYCRKANGSGF